MDQIIKHDSVQEANDRKRKLEDKGNIINNNYQNNYNNNNHNNDHHQQQNRKQETFRTYTATNGYTGNRPLCERCTLHHIGFILCLLFVALVLEGRDLSKAARAAVLRILLMVDSIAFGQEMVNILVSGEAYDKVFNHLDMLHATLESKVLILTTAKSLLLLLV
ncbi:hypothetical protein Tco_0797442 [Tanacetum coccineum]